MGIGNRIKEARENKHWTQSELAERIGVTGSAVTNYENNTSHPKEPILYKLLDALEVDANFLFQDEMQINKQDIYTFAEKALVDKYRNLDLYGKKAIDSLLTIELARINSLKNEETNIHFKKNNNTKYAQIIYYDTPVSAGVGEYLDDSNYIMLDVMEPLPDGTEYIVRVCGDSMEPTYKDGDKLFIKPQDDVEIGEVGIFLINNDVFVKERADNGLISHNDKYKPIYFQNEDVLKCFGKVVGICTKYR